ncbi:replication protein A, subunit RPA32 [Ceraceosorus guamensis]|uniref:Replication protein A, subunit RPA32 n=1 Tax=Ceraceosorus guamensis TaxID=1522189 RepID=A0A316VXX8_9BASI|nr:replication protein A, subunit RPA32 [Ceraceosorus guamensis]PWN42174.1 replication protein A, subunit RPA32 [Ceraceosorus guamensis]
MAGSQGDSPSTKKSGANSLRPVTIRQVLNAEQSHMDADFLVDGVEVGQLTFVGVIRKVAAFPTNVSYDIEDGTGAIEVRQWLEGSDESGDKSNDIRENVYVRVLGTIKTFQNKRSISAGHIRPITNFNEVLFHKLEAIYVHLQSVRSTGAGGAMKSSGAGNAEGSGVNEDKYTHIGDPLQRKIFAHVRELSTLEEGSGVAITTVARRIKAYSEEQVREAVDTLVLDGYLYTAEDDEHVLAT